MPFASVALELLPEQPRVDDTIPLLDYQILSSRLENSMSPKSPYIQSPTSSVRSAAVTLICCLMALGLAKGLSYEDWTNLSFSAGVDLADREPMANPDGDNLLNILEWYAALDPESHDVFPIEIRADGDEFVIEFRRAADLPPLDVFAQIETTSDLSDWRPSGLPISVVSEVDGVQTCEVRTTYDGALEQFFRLSVSFENPDPYSSAAWWAFDESQGEGAVSDSTVFGSGGTLEGGAIRAAGVAGGSALELDGVDDFAEIPLTEALNLDAIDGSADAFSVGAWVKLDDLAHLETEDDEYMILAKGVWTKPPFMEFGLRGGAYRGLFFRMYEDDATGQAYERVIPVADLSPVLRPGAGGADWHHVAFVRDREGKGTLYLDGKPVGENVRADDPVDPPALIDLHADDSPLRNLWIGRGYTRSGSYFHGKLDEVRVFRTALSEAQLTELISASAPDANWMPWDGYQISQPQIFVAPPPFGSDSNPGTEESPYATVGKALDAAHDPGDGRTHILVKHGVYREGLQRLVRPDSPLDRQPGELYIANPDIILEGEPAGLTDAERVQVKGSLAAAVDPAYPLAGLFPTWQDLGGGLHKSVQSGRYHNAQMVFRDGELLRQYGDVSMAGLNPFWRGYLHMLNNDPTNMPEGSFFTAEALELCVPAAGGLAIPDRHRVIIRKGNAAPVVFEFNEKDDYTTTAHSIVIPFSNGRDLRGNPDGVADTQQEIIDKMIAAFTSPAVAPLGLSPTVADGVISLGDRDQGDGTSLSISTTYAYALACQRWELFVKLPAGLDPSDAATNLEVSYSPQLLVIRAPRTKVKGITFAQNNALAISGTSAILVNANDVVLENNEVIWCDNSGLSIQNPAVAGLRSPVENLLLLNNRFSHCGVLGIGGVSSRNCTWIGNETNHNNWRRFDSKHHAGGFKLNTVHENLRINQHTARFNNGYGLWWDTVDGRQRVLAGDPFRIDHIGVRVWESVAELNDDSGYHWEISRNGEFFDNVARYNDDHGFYLSNCVGSSFERNLAVGNKLLGFGFQTGARTFTQNYFNLPPTHPLTNNWSNTFIYINFGAAGNRVVNNIIRNNGAKNVADHDAEDLHLSANAGWVRLPLDTPTADRPSVTLPAPTTEHDVHNQPPLVVGSVRDNISDYNLLWRKNYPVKYGLWHAEFMDWSQYTPALQWDGILTDLKDFDRASDGKADRRLGYRRQTLDSGGNSLFEAFPSAGTFDFDSNSEVRDSFIFFDPPSLPAGDPALGIAVLDPDSDGDGMPDWWEALQGLDPSISTGDHGASGDPDMDGRTNLEEFQNWKLGEQSPGVPYPSRVEYLQHTDPTYTAGGNGVARDMDGDGIPNIWEKWYGLDPNDPADGATHLTTFLDSEIPGPLATDTDADLLPDEWEMAHFGNLDETADGDPDGDGLENSIEFRIWTMPNDAHDPPDVDNDGLSDTWELNFGLRSNDATGDDGANGDPDGDGVNNLDEFRGFSNPRDALSVP